MDIIRIIFSAFGLLFIGVFVDMVQAGRKQPPFIRGDDVDRKPIRPAECQFAKKTHELDSTWFADLGPPFGVMYCIKCECIRVQKKRRVLARVQCRNIKNECPKPTCDEPVLPPGRCCKICPGDPNNPPDLVGDVAPTMSYEEEERNSKDFAALLTGRTSLREFETSAVATGRFTFHKKNLYYSFYFSESMPRPRVLQFTDAEGNILWEQELTLNRYQNSTGKICGVWRRVARSYRKMLREDQLYVSLLKDKESEEEALGGQIAKYPALSTEMFSALLEATPGSTLMRGVGGTAILSVSSAAPSIHITLIFNGVFSPDDLNDVPLVVKLESDKNLVFEEVVKIQKPGHEINIVEVRSAVKLGDLRQMTRGHLSLSVSSRNHPEYRLEGPVLTRVTCEMFESLLSSADSDEEVRPETKTSGLAWMYLERDGTLSYNVRVDDLESIPTALSVVSGRARRRQDLEDLLPEFHDGWTNGTIAKLSPKELEQLYNGDLSINVGSELHDSLIRGKLTTHLIGDARLTDYPLLLKRVDVREPATLSGLAWVAVHQDCSLHYEVFLSGVSDPPQKMKLYLEDLPAMLPGAPVSERLLAEFEGHHIDGFTVERLYDIELTRLDSRIAHLKVVDAESGNTLLDARMRDVRVPDSCLPRDPNNDLPILEDNELPPPDPTKCFHESQFFEEGAQWTAKHDPCMMCSCHRRRVACDSVLCPPVSCANPVQEPGTCCMSCFNNTGILESNVSTAQRCSFGSQTYQAGSTWHPYMPPHGFNRCTICTCDPLTLEVKCSSTQCPPLTCAEKDAIRPDKDACCKVCPPKSALTTANPSQLADESSAEEAQDILNNGGCKMINNVYENGDEWHPRIPSKGIVKCVKCRCKDGRISCSRKKCSRCRRRNQPEDECCSRCRRNRSWYNQKRYRSTSES